MVLTSSYHPGRFLRTKVVDVHELTVGQAAGILGVSRQALSQLLNGHVALTPEMGLRFEKAFGVSMDGLVQMQARYDIAQARSREERIQVRPYDGRLAGTDQPTLL
jgi:addiction module HigA family antidote